MWCDGWKGGGGGGGGLGVMDGGGAECYGMWVGLSVMGWGWG